MDVSLWQVYTLLGMAIAVLIGLPFISGRLREIQLSQAGLGHLQEWSDGDMLRHVARILGAMGYRVQQAGPDYPDIDLILTDGLGQKRAVLIRHWRRIVDDADVTAYAAAAAELGKAPAMMVTIERYTQKAREVARASEIILWSLPDLARAIGEIRRTSVAFPDLPATPTVVNPPFTMEVLPDSEQQRYRRQTLLEELGRPAEDQAAAAKLPMRPRRRPVRLRKGEKWGGGDTPFCPRCGKKMVVRRNPGGDEYWACPTFPRCLGSRPK